jgi:hypothetical protein
MNRRRKNHFKQALDAKREALASAAKQRKPELAESDCERRIREWTSQGYTCTQAEHIILEFSDREGIGQVG